MSTRDLRDHGDTARRRTPVGRASAPDIVVALVVVAVAALALGFGVGLPEMVGLVALGVAVYVLSSRRRRRLSRR